MMPSHSLDIMLQVSSSGARSGGFLLAGDSSQVVLASRTSGQTSLSTPPPVPSAILGPTVGAGGEH